MLAALDAHHQSQPLLPGPPSAELLGALPGNVARDVAERVLAELQAAGALVVEGETVRRPEHRPELPEADRAVAERLLAEARQAGLEPPAPRAWAERLGISLERLRAIAGYLERRGQLVRAPGELWFDAEAVAALRSRVIEHLRREGRLETPAYKELIGTTRRTAVPLMELFDAWRLTIRRGEARFLLDKQAR